MTSAVMTGRLMNNSVRFIAPFRQRAPQFEESATSLQYDY